MNSDLISREELKEHKFPIPLIGDYQQGWNDAIDAIIDNAPTVEQPTDEWCTDCKEYDHEKNCCPRFNKVIRETLKDAQPTGEWIPVKYRPMTDEEFERMKELFGEDIERDDFSVFECPMPKDGQEVLISSHWGVEKDTAHYENGEYWLDCRDNWEGVEAWMPSSEQYKKGGEEE